MDPPGMNIVHGTQDGKAFFRSQALGSQVFLSGVNAMDYIGDHTLVDPFMTAGRAMKDRLFLLFFSKFFQDRLNMLRLMLAIVAIVTDHGLYGSAFLMSHDQDGSHSEVQHRVFYTGQHVFFLHDITGVADYKEISDPFVEQDFRGYPGVGTGDHDSEWLLFRRSRFNPIETLVGMFHVMGIKPGIACLQSFQAGGRVTGLLFQAAARHDQEGACRNKAKWV